MSSTEDVDALKRLNRSKERFKYEIAKSQEIAKGGTKILDSNILKQRTLDYEDAVL